MRKTIFFLTAFAAALFLFINCSAADGDLDPTFGTGGKVTTNIGGTSEQINGLAIQADGKIVAAGTTNAFVSIDFALARYNINGTLDTSFNSAGTLPGTTTLNFGGMDQGNAVVIQPDGKIIVAGVSNAMASSDFALARYTTAGVLDTTFNPGGTTPGTVLTNFTALSSDTARAIALQADGKIIVAGTSNASGNNDFALARYNLDGSLDTTFNPGGTGGVPAGTVVTNFGGTSNDQAFAVTIQADGKIIAVGSSNTAGTTDFALARYNSDGSLDTSFNGTGLVTTSFSLTSSDTGRAVALQPDGKIVVAGFSNAAGTGNDFALARYNTDGSLDAAGFNAAGSKPGTVTTNFSASLSDLATAVAIQEDGKIVAAGVSNGAGAGNNDFALARYTTSGVLDTTFNPTGTLPGTVLTNFTGTSTDQANAVAIQQDGKIVAGGLTGNVSDFALARYENNNPFVQTTITFPTNGLITNDNQLIITGTAQNPSNVTLFLNGIEQLPGTVTTASLNQWTYTPLAPLADGAYLLIAGSHYKSGQVNFVSSAITFTIDATGPVAPVILTPVNNSTINTNTPTISGTASSDSVSVSIAIDSVPIAVDIPVTLSTWSYTLTQVQALSDGAHIVAVTAKDTLGNMSAPTYASFTVDTTGPVAPVILNPVNNSTISDTTPTINGTASSDTVNVDIYLDDALLAQFVPVTAQNWSYALTATQALSNGPHQIEVVPRDAAGNTGSTAIANFTVNTNIAPTSPTVLFPANGSTVNSSIITIAGLASSDTAAVEVTVQSTPFTVIIPVVDGAWSYTLVATQALSNGQHEIIAVSIDAAGNRSAPTIITFVVSATLAMPVITYPRNGSIINATTPTITGTADPSAISILLFIDINQIAQVPVTNGTWSYTLTQAQALTPGFHSATAIALDSAGNASPASDPVRFEVLTSLLSNISAAIRAKYCNLLVS